MCGSRYLNCPVTGVLVGSRTGAALLRPGLSVSPRFLWECLNSHSVSSFPAPATSHAACGFPALRAPAHFSSRVMRPIVPELLSAVAKATAYSIASSRSPDASKRQDGSAFALTYILRLSSCRSMGVFIISPLPPLLTKKPCAAGPLHSTGVTPLQCYYRPSRHRLVFDRFPGAAGYTTYLAPPISRWDEDGFSSCLACPCHRATPTTPPEWATASVRLR